MITDDKKILFEMANTMFALIHQKMEIAALVAKNQNAPKYMYQQALELQDKIISDIAQA